MSAKTHVFRNGVLCVLVFLACFWLAWPVANMPFNDDWSYIKTAQVFAQTGHIVYNGWAAPILGWMIPWGALFIKLFGFSFMAVKLSALPLAVGSLLLFHSILRRFEIGPRNAVIGTLTLGLSPLFLPLSASFMTDVPGLFVILLCLYCCQRATDASTDLTTIAWLGVATVTNVAGGTARQIAWLGVLVMVPCTGWLLRKRRGVLAATAGLWIVGIFGVLYWMRWFAHQPYSIKTSVLPQMPPTLFSAVIDTGLTLDLIGALLLSLLLFVFPVLVTWLPRFGRKFDHYLALFCAGLLPMVAVEILMGRFAEIWPPLILVEELATRKDGDGGLAYDLHHMLIGAPLQIAISLVTLAALFGLVFSIQDKGWRLAVPSESANARKIAWLIAPFSCSYLVLVLPMVWHGESFDRYVLGLMPFAIIGLIWVYQQWIGAELPRVSVALVVVYAGFAVAGTHNYFAWQRARLRAVSEVREAGVPRTGIDAGFVYDGWTQISTGGYVDNPGLRLPANAYQAPPPDTEFKKRCEEVYLQLFPDVHPRYEVGLPTLPCYLRSRFATVHYTAWLPPFRREVKVQRVPGGGSGHVRTRN